MKILLIEDEIAIREVYKELLVFENYVVDEAGDGDSGLTKALAGDWDILLLDIMLPKRDGLEILTHLKAVPELSHKPVVLLTNLDKESILKACMDLGANGYLVKSNINPQDVVLEVQKYINEPAGS